MWDLVIVNPMINALLWLYGILGNNFFLAIAVFTVVLRLVTIPSQIRQMRTSAKIQALQPQIKEIQKKYSDNPQKMQEEFHRIGYNPTEMLGGCFSLLLQMPILLGLYQAIRIVLDASPLTLLDLSNRVYPSMDLAALLPIANKIGWLNMAQPDQFFVLPVLVVASSFLSQKLLTPSPTNNKQNANSGKKQPDDPSAAMTQSMQYTMPLMIGVMSLQLPAGLSIYWVLGNIVSIVIGFYLKGHREAISQVENPSSTLKTANSSENGASSAVSNREPKTPAVSANGRGAEVPKKRRSAKR